MSKWNDIPTSDDTPPEQKAIEFDLQVEENGGTSSPKPETSGNWAPFRSGKGRRK